MTETPRLLAHRYEVGELIGRGGMAEVHRGFDTRLGRDVAIKMLRTDLARDQSFLGRFRREAQSAAGLNHPSVVAIYDSGEDQYRETGGATVEVPFIVMEYVQGHTLRQVLQEQGQLEPDEAARVTEGVLDALAYSHKAGIVHRDIKPANVMIGDDGAIKVMDFGIARAIADTAATMTQTQAVIGTAQYLSPEQAQGQTVDERSDLYSTGCMLFELITGRPPFVGDTPVAIAYQHVGERAPAPSEHATGVSRAYDDIVAHALVKDRAGRYQSAAAFAADLEAARSGRPISAEAAGSALSAAVTQAMPSAAAAAAAHGAADVPTEVYTSRSQVKEAREFNTATMPAIGHDPDDDPPRKRGAAYTALFVLGLALIVGLVWLAMNLLNGNTPAETKAEVPNIVGMQEAAATSLLESRKLTPQPNRVASQKPVGEVISQSTAPNQSVPEGTRINFEVSSGPDTVTIPDLRNKTVAEARAALTALDVVVAAQTSSVDDSEADKGRVDSTEPAAGQEVATGSTVKIKVSSGKVTVPNVIGKSADEARTLLADAGLRPQSKPTPSSQTEGTIIGQTPKDGLADRDSVVVINVATKIPATVTETRTVTLTPTTTPPTTQTPTETATQTPPTTPPPTTP